MFLRKILSVIFNVLIIGTAYVAAYFAVVSHAQNNVAMLAFCIGALSYLVTRHFYKQDSSTNKLMFKSYRLVVWSLPILLFIINFHLYFSAVESKEFIAYRSFEDLMYFGPFVLAIWPLFLIAYLVGNLLILFEMLFKTLHLPVIVTLSVLLVIALGFAYKRLYTLKKAAKISFSIPFAITIALAPIMLSTYLLIEVLPSYLH